MSVEVWLAFIATSVVILMIPGPTILTVVSYSLLHGRRAFVPIVTAVVLGDSTAITVSLLGLGTLLVTSAYWFTAIKWAGGVYLLYLGIRFLRSDRPTREAATRTAAQSNWQLFCNTYLVAVLNPKGIVFYVAFFPQFLNSTTAIGTQLSTLAVTFVALGSLNVSFYALFAASSRTLLATPRAQRRLRIAGGTLLSAAGAYALLGRQAP